MAWNGDGDGDAGGDGARGSARGEMPGPVDRKGGRPSHAGLKEVHARFARTVVGIYVGTAAVAVALLVGALATDLTNEEDLARNALLLNTEVRAEDLSRNLELLSSELTRLGLLSETRMLERDPETARDMLRVTHEKSALFNVGVAVVGADGTAVWSEPLEFLPTGVSFREAPWFQTALRSRVPVLVPVLPERRQDALLYVVSPIVRDGAFVGALLGGVDLALGGALDPEIHRGPHAQNLLVGRLGQVIYPATPPPYSLEPAWPALVHAASGAPFVEDTDIAGSIEVLAGAPVEGTDFQLLSMASAATLLGPARDRFRTRLTLGAALALVPMLLLVFALSRSFRVYARSEEVAFRDERLRLLGEAVDLIAHEVKNSLNGLRVGLDLVLRSDRAGSEARESRAVSGLRTEIERLSEFTTELLSFSKGVSPRPVSMELVGFARKVVQLASETASRSGVALEISACEPSVVVRADPALVHVVIANLVGNALDALSAASVDRPEVRVVIGRHGVKAFLRVEDNGPGVAESVRARLFEPFVTGKPNGVGIGLAFSRRIARAHGGELELERPGPAPSFLLTLPVEASPS